MFDALTGELHGGYSGGFARMFYPFIVIEDTRCSEVCQALRIHSVLVFYDFDDSTTNQRLGSRTTFGRSDIPVSIGPSHA